MNQSHTALHTILCYNTITSEGILPLELQWVPQEDISVYELALCIPFLMRQDNVMPYEFDIASQYARHWKVSNPNNIKEYKTQINN